MAGLGSAAAFQVSGDPWVTGSHISASIAYKKIDLPRVCKSITIYNVDASQVHPYTMTGSTELIVFFGPDLTGTYPPLQVTQNHSITIPISGSKTFDTKVSQVFVAKKAGANTFGAFQAFAELTAIPVSDLFGSGSGGPSTVREGYVTGSGVDSLIG